MDYRTPDGALLRLGIQSPIVVQTPGAHARWEGDAGPDGLRRVVVAADRLGYHHLTCSEHVAVPEAEVGRRGVMYWDPVATLAWAAALTERIRLATNVVVLGYHHPLEILKAYGTLDLLAGGRLVLGVGVGSLREEFEILGAPFMDRGPRADDALAAIRSGWGRAEVAHTGPYYEYGPVTVAPHAPRTDVPVWIGGRTRRSLRRAVSFGTGWAPFAVTPAQVREWLAGVDAPPGLDIVLGPSRPLDPRADADATRRALDELAAAGATVVHAAFVHHDLDDYVGQLEALAGLAADSRGAG